MAIEIEDKKEQRDIRKPQKVYLTVPFLIWHIAGLVVFAALFMWLSMLNVIFIAQDVTADNVKSEHAPPPIPKGIEYKAWYTFPVQKDGRIKPLLSATNDTNTEIVGRQKFERINSLAMALYWLFENHPQAASPDRDWDDVPFILCQNQDLRRLIFKVNRDEEKPIVTKSLAFGFAANPMAALAGPVANQAQQCTGAAFPVSDEESRFSDTFELMGPATVAESKDPVEARKQQKDFEDYLREKKKPVVGKYMSPNALRKFLSRMKMIQSNDVGTYNKLIDPLEKEIGEIWHPNPAAVGRLELYDKIHKQRLLIQDIKDNRPFISIVALDKVKGTPWFSIPELRLIQVDEKAWDKLLRERVARTPYLYLSEDHRKALKNFQESIRTNTSSEYLDKDLSPILADYRKKDVAKYKMLRKTGQEMKAAAFLSELLRTWPRAIDPKVFFKQFTGVMPLLADANIRRAKEELTNPSIQKELDSLLEMTYPERVELFFKQSSRTRQTFLLVLQRTAADDTAMVSDILTERDRLKRHDLQTMIDGIEYYSPEKSEFRWMHMNYLEMRHPNLYSEEVIGWQKAPQKQIAKVLNSYDALGDSYRKTLKAYKKGDKAAIKIAETEFNKKSQEFFDTIAKVSEETTGNTYPGEDTVLSRMGSLWVGESGQPSRSLLQTELTFLNVRPFMWAWILMLGAMLGFTFSLGFNSRICYIIGFSLFAVSLVFQTYGFFTRIIIAARPPVTNMYETVIWVAFMSSIFALILELVYRSKVIALAGAMVSTLGLVLADQLPLAFDPGIEPLVPVLRSNFWLTIHVLTIVSSYAGGTLAWGLGNITLFLIVFGSSERQGTIKVLSNFTYRALQIAVVLLAIGTFLGGWWAAYSWGRFWGWDPKETGALIALICYVIPLHMRFIGWIREFGMAVSAILCYSTIILAWYGINFIIPAGLHSYGEGAGGLTWVSWAACLNMIWVLTASLLYHRKLERGLTENKPTVA